MVENYETRVKSNEENALKMRSDFRNKIKGLENNYRNNLASVQKSCRKREEKILTQARNVKSKTEKERDLIMKDFKKL